MPSGKIQHDDLGGSCLELSHTQGTGTTFFGWLKPFKKRSTMDLHGFDNSNV